MRYVRGGVGEGDLGKVTLVEDGEFLEIDAHVC